MNTAKPKTLALSSGWTLQIAGGKPAYRVEKITNSVAYEPGVLLSKEQTEALCADRAWTVTISAKR